MTTIRGVPHLQVPPQPLVLLKEELQSKLQIKVDLGGERDDVHRPQVPAVDTGQFSNTQNKKKTQIRGKTKLEVMLYECSVPGMVTGPLKCLPGATLTPPL